MRGIVGQKPPFCNGAKWRVVDGVGEVAHNQASTDLLNWSSAGTNQIFQDSLDFVDMDAVSNTVRFYHAIPQLDPPAH